MRKTLFKVVIVILFMVAVSQTVYSVLDTAQQLGYIEATLDDMQEDLEQLELKTSQIKCILSTRG